MKQPHPLSLTCHSLIGPFPLVGIHTNTPINETSHSHTHLPLLSLSPSLCVFSPRRIPQFSPPSSLNFPLKPPHSSPAMHDLQDECNFIIWFYSFGSFWIRKMLVEAAMESSVNGGGAFSQLHQSCGDSSEEELSVLPRHTKVVVTGNNRTKSVLVGLQGVVKKAVGLGGWHWLVNSSPPSKCLC